MGRGTRVWKKQPQCVEYGPSIWVEGLKSTGVLGPWDPRDGECYTTRHFLTGSIESWCHSRECTIKDIMLQPDWCLIIFDCFLSVLLLRYNSTYQKISVVAYKTLLAWKGLRPLLLLHTLKSPGNCWDSE